MSSDQVLNLSLREKLGLRYWSSIFAIFFLIQFTHLPFLHHFGVLVDDGYYLANQCLANHYGIQFLKICPWWWLTDVIAGWWMNLSASFGLWGAKFGYVLFVGLSGAISAYTLFQVEKPRLRHLPAFIAVFVLTSLCLHNVLLNYNVVPALFFSIFALFFLRINIDPANNLNPAIAGIAFVLMVFSRLPLLCTLCIPVICLVISYKMNRELSRPLIYSYTKMIAVVFLFFILLNLYTSGNLLRNYISFEAPATDHSFYHIITVTLKFLLRKLPYMIFISAAAYLIYFLIKMKLLSKMLFYVGIAVPAFSLLIYLIGGPGLLKSSILLLLPDAFDVFPSLVAINIVCYCLLRKNVSFPEIVLMVLAISWPILRSIGSATGMMAFGVQAGFLLCGLALIFMIRVAKLYECAFPLLCIGSCMFITISYRFYGDYNNAIHSHYKKTVGHHNIQKLNGLYMPPELADCLDSLIPEIQKYAKNGDRILACPYNSLLYYLTGTLPAGDHACLFYLDFEPFKRKIDQISENQPPVLIVRTKIDFSDLEMLKRTAALPTDAKFLSKLKMDYFNEKLIEGFNAKLIWSNALFDLFVPSNESQFISNDIRSTN